MLGKALLPPAGRIVVVLALGCMVSCSSRRALELFFDVPERPSAEREVSTAPQARSSRESGTTAAASAPPTAEGALSPSGAGPERDKLPIEKVRTWAEAEALLPKDELGEVDWMEALRAAVIAPRSSVEPGKEAFVFKFDFHFPGPEGVLGAYFPHSVHTQWLACESCHPTVFPQPGTPLSMATILTDDYCGTCHTKVAFPIAKGCNRCHANKS